jgi:allantoicase
MIEDIEYKVEAVKATSVASEEIDKTFRSSCIGKRF